MSPFNEWIEENVIMGKHVQHILLKSWQLCLLPTYLGSCLTYIHCEKMTGVEVNLGYDDDAETSQNKKWSSKTMATRHFLRKNELSVLRHRWLTNCLICFQLACVKFQSANEKLGRSNKMQAVVLCTETICPYKIDVLTLCPGFLRKPMTVSYMSIAFSCLWLSLNHQGMTL